MALQSQRRLRGLIIGEGGGIQFPEVPMIASYVKSVERFTVCNEVLLTPKLQAAYNSSSTYDTKHEKIAQLTFFCANLH